MFLLAVALCVTATDISAVEKKKATKETGTLPVPAQMQPRIPAPTSTLTVVAREFILTSKGEDEPVYKPRGTPQSWRVPIREMDAVRGDLSKEVRGAAQFNDQVAFAVAVSGRGRINLDVTDSTYLPEVKRAAHWQDDQFEGFTVLIYQYRDNQGGDCKLEIKAWRTK